VPEEISLLDILIVLARRKRFILRFTAAVTVLTAIIVFLLPKQYTAETVILPPAQNSSMANTLMSQLSGGAGALASMAGGSLGIKNPGDMYVALFRTRTVEDAVIQRFGLMARYKKKRMTDARKAFEKHATVALGSKDGLIRINVRDRDPKLASDIANGYVEEFRKLSASLAITEASQRRLFFQQQLSAAKDDLANAEEAMKRTEQTTGVLQIDSQAKLLIESASMLRAQVVAKQVQIQSMRSFATDDNPELVLARQQLAALQAQLAKLGGSEQESDSLVVPKGKVPEAGMEYIRRFRDVKYHETIFELIAKQLEIAKLDEARQGAVIQVADVAVPPDRASSLSVSVVVVLAALGAFLLSAFWVLISAQFAEANRQMENVTRIQTLRALLFNRE
jgi:uncharacterized protein involved in exopolysaccharide biosynthesis